jgi:hypothetical protein
VLLALCCGTACCGTCWCCCILGFLVRGSGWAEACFLLLCCCCLQTKKHGQRAVVSRVFRVTCWEPTAGWRGTADAHIRDKSEEANAAELKDLCSQTKKVPANFSCAVPAATEPHRSPWKALHARHGPRTRLIRARATRWAPRSTSVRAVEAFCCVATPRHAEGGIREAQRLLCCTPRF